MTTKAYPTFNGLHEPLRSYNRYVVYHNIRATLGLAAAMAYVRQFKHDDLVELLKFGNKVAVEGYSNVRRSIIREMNSNG